MRKRTVLGVACIIAAAACGGTNGTRGKEAAAPTVTPGLCQAPASNARPIGKVGNSATVALARIAERRVALVADEDAKAVLTFDLDTHATLAETPLGATPGQIYVAGDGRIVVTLRDKNEIAVLVASRADAPLGRACTAPTPAEPIAVAATNDDATIVVSAGWGRALAAYDAKTLAPKMNVVLPREPRGVVISDDGKTAFVSHAVGSNVSAVDLADAKHAVKAVAVRGWMPGEEASLAARRKMIARMKKENSQLAEDMDEQLASEERRAAIGRPSCQGFALAKSTAVPGRIFAPQVLVDPGDPESRPDGYGDENSATESPDVAVIDEDALEPIAASVTIHPGVSRGGPMIDPRDPRPDCLLPRAAAVDSATKALLVTCYGIDQVVAYDATAASPFNAERRRWTVGSGPSGVAVDPEKHRAVVWSQFDRTLSAFPIGGVELADDKLTPVTVRKTAAAPLKEKLPAEVALGRILFHAAGDSRISSDGRACASCHPDGRDDAITWATPEGPRRSISLAGRVTATPPYSWNGNEQTLHNHLGNTFDRLSGKGLRSIELDALVAYVSRLPVPTQRNQSTDQAKVSRGAAIFASKETGCSSCHSGATFTDGKNHDVGSKTKSDRAAEFNTPSLHLVGGSGPYFHDGRYATLGDLLKKSDGMMGRTGHLSGDDLDALEAYLRTL